MVTLRQLEIFLAVARREHVTAAARDVHLSQSAVSAALAELADQLGGPLFERRGRRLVRNDRGRRLTDDAADLLQRAAELVRRYRSDDEVAGTLRVGASSTIGTYLLPGLIATFVAAHPGAEFVLEVGNTEAIEQQLAERALDLAFIEGPSHDPRLDAVPWRDDELVVFAQKSHPLARRRPQLPALAAERWVLREPGSGTRAVFEAALREHGLQLPHGLTFGHSEAVKDGVRAGLGIACLSALALRREFAAGEFVRLRVPGLDLRRRLWQLTRRGAFAGALQRAFAAHVAAAALQPAGEA